MANAAPKLLIVGSINRDLIFYGPHGSQMKPNACLVFDSWAAYHGGKGANQAAAAAVLGAHPTLVGAVGSDPAGEEIASALKALGVDVSGVARVADTQTGLSAIFTMPDGSYVGTNVLGANGRIIPAMVEAALDAQPFDMVLMQLEMPLETVYRTHELARERGLRVILDAGPAQRIDLTRLKGIYMISPNEAETEALTGVVPSDEDSALKACRILVEAAQARYTLLKLGGRGAYLYDGERGISFPAFNVQCVDSTAAGDTFTTALMMRICLGETLPRAIRYANAAAGLCVSRRGGLASVPTADEVSAFLREQEDAL